jgi:hypothetical protein
MSSIPTNLDAKLKREQTSQALKEAGFPIEPATLATMATRGGGPRFQKFGARVLYRWGDVLEWAKSRLSEPHSNTSEGDAAGQAARSESAPPSSSAAKKSTKSTKPSRRGETPARRRQRNRAETEVTA